MEVNIIEEKGNELKLEIKDEGHTLGNLIQHELLKDKNIEYASYVVPHPLIKSMILYIKSVGRKSPKKTLLEALARSRNNLDKLLEAFEKAKADMD